MQFLRAFRPLCVLAFVSTVFSADLSPEKWGAQERARVEALAQLPTPPSAHPIDAKSGVVSATMSPIAVRAGLAALQQGGTAADAAACIALTQITTALGSYVSYAGALQLTYYEAKTNRVYAMNAGWNSYLGETDPPTIATADQPDAAPGRKTLVPGFMAGLASMHQRFGALPFADLFSPAIWYADNGVTLSPTFAGFFTARQTYLARTAEGRAFIHQASPDRLPAAGDRFVQAELAKTLRAVAKHGAEYMYTGEWGQAFVATVQGAGGKVSLDDLKRYQPIWEEPLRTTFCGYTIHAPGASTEGGYQILQTLNLLEALKTSSRRPYWQEPQTLVDLSRVLQFSAAGTAIHGAVAATGAAAGLNLTLQDRATKPYANTVLPLLDLVFNPAQKVESPKHSDAIVVIDRWGNVAALVHTINTVLWGSAGLVVGGVPLSDAACYQQSRLSALKPGDRVPNEMAPLIALADGKPTVAIACIGVSLVPETARLLLATLAHNVDLPTAMAAPPLLLNVNFTQRATIHLPENGYDADFLKNLRALGITVELKPQQEVWNLKGTAVIAEIDGAKSSRGTVELPTIFSFAAGY